SDATGHDGLTSAIARVYGPSHCDRAENDRLPPDEAVRTGPLLPISPRSTRCAGAHWPPWARSRSRRRGLHMTSPLPTPVRTHAFINGEFVPSASGATFESVNPATGEVLTEISSCDAEEVDRAVAAARASFASDVWSRMLTSDRREVLMRLVALLEENLEDLALMVSIDAGKPITDCREFDLPDTIGSIRWYAEAADKVFGKTTAAGDDALGLIVHEPIGVVGAVLPMGSWTI